VALQHTNRRLRGETGVTLVVLMDSCFGGGFTGGVDDIQESSCVSVIGTVGECPSGTIDLAQLLPFVFDLYDDEILTVGEAVASRPEVLSEA
jgi:hypothetical protein